MFDAQVTDICEVEVEYILMGNSYLVVGSALEFLFIYAFPPSFVTMRTYTKLGTVGSHDCECCLCIIYIHLVREGVSISHHPTYTNIIPIHYEKQVLYYVIFFVYYNVITMLYCSL